VIQGCLNVEINVILIDTSNMDTENAMERVKVAGNPVMENVLMVGLHVEIVAILTIRKITTGAVVKDAFIKLNSAMESVLLALQSVEQIYVLWRIVGWQEATESVEINAFTNIPSVREHAQQNINHVVLTDVFEKETVVVTSPVADLAFTKVAGRLTITSPVEIDVCIDQTLKTIMSVLQMEVIHSALGKVNLVMGTVLPDMSYARIDVTKVMKFQQVAALLLHQLSPHKGRKPPPQKKKKSLPQRRRKHQLNRPQVKRKPL